jgi:hypothetical protein
VSLRNWPNASTIELQLIVWRRRSRFPIVASCTDCIPGRNIVAK